MTEISPLGTLNQLRQKHDGPSPEDQAELRVSFCRPPFGVDLRLISEDSSRVPHEGETLEDRQMHGYGIVDSYFGVEDSSPTEDGWFDTGDVAKIDADGFMVIRDRPMTSSSLAGMDLKSGPVKHHRRASSDLQRRCHRRL